MTDLQVAEEILRRQGLDEVRVEIVRNLTDHYDPRSRVVRLSNAVYNGIPLRPWVLRPMRLAMHFNMRPIIPKYQA